MGEIGNSYWKIRSKDGRDFEYKTVEEFIEKANEYFQFVQDNPFKEQDFRGQAVIEVSINKMRPMSLEGFCNFADICVNTFKSYEQRNDFVTVTRRIRQIIENQQFEGAASGFLNANIIARKLGLSDKQDLSHNLGTSFERELID